jgi:hypothetical protein
MKKEEGEKYNNSNRKKKEIERRENLDPMSRSHTLIHSYSEGSAVTHVHVHACSRDTGVSSFQYSTQINREEKKIITR